MLARWWFPGLLGIGSGARPWTHWSWGRTACGESRVRQLDSGSEGVQADEAVGGKEIWPPSPVLTFQAKDSVEDAGPDGDVGKWRALSPSLPG